MPRNFTTHLLAAFFAGALLVWAVADTPNPQLAFQSISVDGTNLVLRAIIPAGLEKGLFRNLPVNFHWLG